MPVESLIEREIESGTPANRIMIGGFSQGGAVSLYTALSSKYLLNSVLVLSSYLPCRFSVINKIPVFIAHGTEDSIVPPQWADQAQEYLKSCGIESPIQKYRMGHASCDEEMRDIASFIKQRISCQ